MGYVKIYLWYQKARATLEDKNFRKKPYGGIYLYETWKLDLLYSTTECQKFLEFYNILLLILCNFANLAIYCLFQVTVS